MKLVGIDIGSATVKLLQLKKDFPGYQVVAEGIELLPPGTVVDGEVKNIRTLRTTLKRLLDKTRCSAREAAIALPDTLVTTETIQIREDYTEAERQEAIAAQAHEFSESSEGVNLDYVVLGPARNLGGYLDVLLVTCRREHLEPRLEVLEWVGLKPHVVDVESYAQERALDLVRPEESPIALVDIGMHMTTLTHYPKVIDSYKEDGGGNLLVHALQKQYTMTQEEALLALREHALPSGYEAAVYRPFVQVLAEQIQHMQRDTPIHPLFLSGGVATLPGFAAVVETFLKIPVKAVNLFMNMSMNKTIAGSLVMRDAPALMVSCGLALRAFDLHA